jgi:hypothetical protein
VSDRDDLRRDAEGFLDMDRFEAADLDPETYEALRETLIGAELPTPSAERFDNWVEQALEANPDAPDTTALVPGDAAADQPPTALDAPWEEDLSAGASDFADDPDGIEDGPEGDDSGDGLT